MGKEITRKDDDLSFEASRARCTSQPSYCIFIFKGICKPCIIGIAPNNSVDYANGGKAFTVSLQLKYSKSNVVLHVRTENVNSSHVVCVSSKYIVCRFVFPLNLWDIVLMPFAFGEAIMWPTSDMSPAVIEGNDGEPKRIISYIAGRVVETRSFGIIFQAKCLETKETVVINYFSLMY
ncbi:hypothetical protein ACFE04_007193 [Oxalis oulophora]